MSWTHFLGLRFDPSPLTRLLQLLLSFSSTNSGSPESMSPAEVGIQGPAQIPPLPTLPSQAQPWALGLTPISQVVVAGCAHPTWDIPHPPGMAEPALARLEDVLINGCLNLSLHLSPGAGEAGEGQGEVTDINSSSPPKGKGDGKS